MNDRAEERNFAVTDADAEKPSVKGPETLDITRIMREYYRNRFLHYKESENSDEQFSG